MNVCCVTVVVKDSGVLSLGVLTYVVCLCKGCGRAGLRELEALGEALGEVNLVAPNEIEK